MFVLTAISFVYESNSMPRTVRKQQLRLARQAADLMFAAPWVVALRTGRMLAAGAAPNARDRAEFELMSAEKVDAWREGWTAMAAQGWRSQQALAASMMTLWAGAWLHPWAAFFPGGEPAPRRGLVPSATQWHGAMLRVLADGMAPVHRRAVANARRLSVVKGGR